MSNQWVEDVLEMYNKNPKVNSKNERIAMMLEELSEYARAETAWDELDALLDLIWFAIGTAVQNNYPICAGWELVAKANLAKLPGKGKRGIEVDFIKPEGWKPPAIENLFLQVHKIAMPNGKHVLVNQEKSKQQVRPECFDCKYMVCDYCTYDPDKDDRPPCEERSKSICDGCEYDDKAGCTFKYDTGYIRKPCEEH